MLTSGSGAGGGGGLLQNGILLLIFGGLHKIFKYLVSAAQKTQHVCVTKINWLMLPMEMIAVCSENCTNLMNAVCEQKVVTDC
jgi:hypothetical protein